MYLITFDNSEIRVMRHTRTSVVTMNVMFTKQPVYQKNISIIPTIEAL
jgi:hypothetical protein